LGLYMLPCLVMSCANMPDAWLSTLLCHCITYQAEGSLVLWYRAGLVTTRLLHCLCSTSTHSSRACMVVACSSAPQGWPSTPTPF
jgi:hypothetical protein